MPYKRGAPFENRNRLKHGRYASVTLNLRRACRRALYEAQERLADARMLAARVRALKAIIKLQEQRERQDKD
jgi:hypothetical protein